MASKKARKHASVEEPWWQWLLPMKGSRDALWGMVFLYVPILLWSGLWLWLLAQGLSWWVAVPLALVLGFVCWLVTGVMNNGHLGTVFEMAVGSTIGFLLALLLVPVFVRARDKARTQICLSNMKVLGQAILVYEADNDAKLPPSDRWSDAIRPFIPASAKVPPSTKTFFNCPEAGNKPAFAMNDAATESKRTTPVGQTVLLFESSMGGMNAHDSMASLIRPGRHRGGNNYLFSDGKAKWFKDGSLVGAIP
jgi:hypothetical protein